MRKYIYVAYLHLKGKGVVDLVERHDLLQAIDAWEVLVDEARCVIFGEGIYEATLYREFFDENGLFVKGERLKKLQVKVGDSR